jgi:hypothetical protein
MVAMGQEAFLKTQVGTPGMYKYCRSMYPCGTPFASDATGIYTGIANPQKAAQMLKEAGYDGTPVLLMRPTDLAAIAKLPLVAKQRVIDHVAMVTGDEGGGPNRVQNGDVGVRHYLEGFALRQGSGRDDGGSQRYG